MKLQNGSQVTTRPAADTTSGSPGYFSTSNDKGEPSYPGKDWFNNIIDELLNAINAAGVTYDSSKLTNLASAISAVRDASNLNAGTISVDLLPTGSGNKLDADKLDGQEGSYYRNASNLNAGTVPLARLPSGKSGGIDAAKLEGQDSSYYRNASNLNAGTVPLVRLPVTIASASQILAGSSTSAVVTPKALVEAGVLADYTGSVHWFATQITPTGFIKANGAILSIAKYPELYAKIGFTFGGNGTTTFGVPDLRGEFIRGWDDGRGVDNGRVFGSWQEDAIRNITGDFGAFRTEGNASANGAFTALNMGGDNAGDGDDGNTYSISFDASTQVPTGPQNVPRNISLIAYIKY